MEFFWARSGRRAWEWLSLVVAWGGVGWGGGSCDSLELGVEWYWLLIEVRKAADCSWTIKRGRLS